MSVSCLFEHPQFFIIHKPANVPFHSLEEDTSKGPKELIEGVVTLAKRLLNTEMLFPVHRLDRMTSGLMIFARSQEAASTLSVLFEQKRIEKYYLALSASKPKKKQGLISGDMQKSRGGSYILKRTYHSPAVTRFFCQRHVFKQGDYWFFVLKPETGKTHQLRVALKSLGSPILGDQRYSGGMASRGYLHAYKLNFSAFNEHFSFVDPYFSGSDFSLESDAPYLFCPTEADLTSHSRGDSQPVLIECPPEKLSWPKSSVQIIRT